MKFPKLKLTFAFKIASATAVLSVAALAVFAYLSFTQHSTHLMAIMRDALAATVRNAAPLVEAQHIDPASPESVAPVRELLNEFRLRNPNISGFRFFVLTDTGPLLVASSVSKSPSGAPLPFPTAPQGALEAAIGNCLRSRHTCVTALYSDTNGRWVSAFAPIEDADGNLVAVLAGDRRAVEYEAALAGTVREMLYYSLAALAASIVMGAFVSRRVTRPLRRLYLASRSARLGEYKPVEPSGSDEIATLTRDFNETQAALQQKMEDLEVLAWELEERVAERTGELQKSYDRIHDQQELLQREITVARSVQETIRPQSLVTDRIAIDVAYLPIMGLGGDWGVVSHRSDGAFDVAVGDVTGHGLGAALVVNRVYTLVSQFTAANARLDWLLHRLDYFLSGELADIGIYMTYLGCRMNLDTMTLQYVSGGHLPILIYRDGAAQPILLENRCGVLGVGELFCDDEPIGKIPLEHGDMVFFYTDGLVEALDHEGRQFGAEKLYETISNAIALDRSSGKILSHVTDAVKSFTGGYLQDDVLLIVAQIK